MDSVANILIVIGVIILVVCVAVAIIYRGGSDE